MSRTSSPDEQRSVVWISHRNDERCSRCGKEIWKGTFIVAERVEGIRCLDCAGFGDLVFLASGDAALTRRAVAHSSRSAVVVRWSRTRGRNERQGVLVERKAIERAEEACKGDADRRAAKRDEQHARRQAEEKVYRQRFTARILELFPSCALEEAEAIALHACQKYSGRVGRSGAAKQLDAAAVTLAVRAHVRHAHTKYDALLMYGYDRFDARAGTRVRIEAVLELWRRSRPSGGQGP